MTDDKITLHIGSLDEMGRRFVDAWHRADAGQSIERDHVTFVDLESFLSAMSGKRLELLRRLRATGPLSIRQLGVEIGRDYKSVHQDVALLRTAGLIDKMADGKVAVLWEKAITELDLAA